MCFRACVRVRGFRCDAHTHPQTHTRTHAHARSRAHWHSHIYKAAAKISVRMCVRLCVDVAMRVCQAVAHQRASPLAKQTRYGFSFSVSTAIAKPYPWRQCFVRLEGWNASGTPLPSIHASSFPASDASPADSSSPSAWAAFGLQSSRIANTTPLAAWAKKAHIATKLSHMNACEHTHTRVKQTRAPYVGRLQRSEPTGGPIFECE